jgi:hypothetical protein
MEEHGTNFLEPPPELIEGAEEYEVEKVLGHRTYGWWKKKQYLIKWKGYSEAHNSWEPEKNVNTLDLVKEYYLQHRTKTRRITYKGTRRPYQKAMPPRIHSTLHSHLSHIKNFDYFVGNCAADGIQQALKGREVQTYTPTEYSQPVVSHHDDLKWRDNPPAGAFNASPQHFGSHLYAREEDPSVEVLQIGELSLAPLPPMEELLGMMLMSSEQTSPGYPGDTGGTCYGFDPVAPASSHDFDP